MKKVLVLTPILPYPPDDGSRLRTYQVLKFLTKRFTVDLISFYLETEDLVAARDFLKQFCKDIYLLSQGKTRQSKYKLFFYSVDKEKRKEISNIIREKKYDVIQAEKVISLVYLDTDILKNYKVVLDSWGIDSEISFQIYKMQKNFFSKFLSYLKYLRHYYSELFLLSQINYFVAITDKSYNFYSKHFKNKKIFLVPNAVDLEYFCSDKDIPVEKGRISFVGIMNFLPNIDAVMFFCKEVVPQLRKKIDFKFYIIGKNPTKEVLNLANGKDIIVTGEVKDIKEHFLKSEVIVIPLRMGSGLRNKVIQAMACGKTVVATKDATEGLNVEDNVNILIANTPEEFVEKILLALNNKELNLKIGENARKYVEENFSYDVVEKKWFKVYDEIFSSNNNSK